MVFMKCEATLATPYTREELRRVENESATDLCDLSDEMRQASDNTVGVFMSTMHAHSFILGIIAPSHKEAKDTIVAYLDKTPFVFAAHTEDEISFGLLNSLLMQAVRRDFVDDREEFLQHFGLENLMQGSRNNFGENLISPQFSITRTRKKVQEALFADTMLPELERIAQGTADTAALGHPVHYLLQCDDVIARKTVHQALLGTLYRYGRIRNRRYTFVDFNAQSHLPGAAFNSLYRANEGGTMIIRYTEEDTEESGYGHRGDEVIAALCNVAVRYKNSVLTILCLPAAARRVKEEFLHRWGDTAFIELREDVIHSRRAQQVLRVKAKQLGLRADKELLDTVADETVYTMEHLNRVFDSWHSHKLRHQAYPQYSSAATVKATVMKMAPVGSAYERLQSLVGLTEAKEVMQKALTFFKAQKLFSQRGMCADRPSMHMVFTGNPGTAKTTVARLFAEILRENGLLDKGTFYEVGRADLVGKYVGHTAPLVKAAFAKAKGGVLFIDEAYSLVDGRDGMYGDEAINTIVQEMENNRQDTLVIFAGYPDKMEAFLERNPGLRSRIAFHIPFADYSAEELCAIAAHIAGKQNLTLSEEAMEKLRRVFAVARKQGDFGNGRYARNLVEKARMAQASRLMSGDVSAITDRQLSTLCAEDIEAPQMDTPTVIPIGFCA